MTLGVLRRIFHWHEKRTDEFRSPIIRGMARQNTMSTVVSASSTTMKYAGCGPRRRTDSPFSRAVRFALADERSAQ